MSSRGAARTRLWIYSHEIPGDCPKRATIDGCVAVKRDPVNPVSFNPLQKNVARVELGTCRAADPCHSQVRYSKMTESGSVAASDILLQNEFWRGGPHSEMANPLPGNTDVPGRYGIKPTGHAERAVAADTKRWRPVCRGASWTKDGDPESPSSSVASGPNIARCWLETDLLLTYLLRAIVAWCRGFTCAARSHERNQYHQRHACCYRLPRRMIAIRTQATPIPSSR